MTMEEISVAELPLCAGFWHVPEDAQAFKLARYMESGARRAFVYCAAGQPVGGCALSMREQDCGHISYFAVAPAFRRRGIGGALMAFAVEYFKDRAVENVSLYVEKGNVTAIALYEEMGFRYAFDADAGKIAMTRDTVRPVTRGEKRMIYTAKIEQTRDYPQRMKYIAATDTFIAKDCPSLSYARHVPEPYGWLTESGTPPCPHLDVIVMTDRTFALGDELPVRIIGVFCRNDGDHKLVGVPLDRDIDDFSRLPDEEQADMRRLYPRADAGEGWYGAARAEEIVAAFFAEKSTRSDAP